MWPCLPAPEAVALFMHEALPDAQTRILQMVSQDALMVEPHGLHKLCQASSAELRTLSELPFQGRSCRPGCSNFKDKRQHRKDEQCHSLKPTPLVCCA